MPQHLLPRTALLALLVTVLLGALVPARPVLAQGDGEPLFAPNPGSDGATAAEKEAERLYKIAELQFEGQEFGAAALTFEKAFGLDPNAILAFNVARACENDGQLDRARLWYDKALTLSPPEEVRVRASTALVRLDRSRATLQKEVAAAAPTTAHLTVTADVHAEVHLDRQLVGETPWEGELEPRAYDLELTAAGRLPFRQRLEVAAGDKLQVAAALPEPPPLLSWVGWTGMGVMVVGGVGIGAGAYYESDAQASFDEANQLSVKRSPSRFEELRSDGETEKSFAQLFYYGGAGVLSAGLVMLCVDLAVNLSAEEEDGASTLRLGVRPDGLVLDVPF